jgi:hypothetical protein
MVQLPKPSDITKKRMMNKIRAKEVHTINSDEEKTETSITVQEI